MLRFKNEVGVESKEEQAEVGDDPDEEDMDYVNLDDERETSLEYGVRGQ